MGQEKSELITHLACFFTTARKKPCYAVRAVQAGKPMTADGDRPLWPAPGLATSCGLFFAAPFPLRIHHRRANILAG
jgi:hypothetical protein